MKNILDSIYSVFKLNPFFWFVLSIALSFILFAPHYLLTSFGLDVIPGALRTLLGLIDLIAITCILCAIVKKAYNWLESHYKIWKTERGLVKELMKLSYLERLLLYNSVSKLEMNTVYAPLNNSIAQILMDKGVLKQSISIADPLKYPFIIQSKIYDLLVSHKKLLFKEFLNISDEQLMRELQSLFHDL